MKARFGGTAPDGTDRTESPGVVTVLRVVGRDVELRLSPEERTWSLGAAKHSVDLYVTSRDPPDDESQKEYVSRVHATITRRGSQLWIEKSRWATNGLMFASGHKQDEGAIGAGGSFIVGGPRGVKLLALDESMVVLRKELQWVLGRRAHATLDAALEVITRNASLLLVGERGCDQRELAKQIHFTSPRRQARLVDANLGGSEADMMATLREAEGGTLYVELAATTKPVPRTLITAVVEDRLRVIVAATAAADFDERFTAQGQRPPRRPPELRIPPLRERSEDIPVLLNTLFARRAARSRSNGSARRSSPSSRPTPGPRTSMGCATTRSGYTRSRSTTAWSSARPRRSASRGSR